MSNTNSQMKQTLTVIPAVKHKNKKVVWIDGS